MLFGKKKTLTRQELDLQVFKTKVELRSLMDKYQTLLERELRQARAEKEAGIARPSNYERIRTIASLIGTTEAAYQNMDHISTTDELNRTTNELTAVLANVNRLSQASEQPNVGGINRGLKNVRVNEEKMDREYRAQSAAISKRIGDTPGFSAELKSILDEAIGPELPVAEPAYTGTPSGGTPVVQTVAERPMTDAELEAEMDAINAHLYSVLEDI